MRAVRFAFLAVGLLPLGAPPVSAGNVSTYTGSCHLATAEESTGLLANPDTWLGAVYVDVAVTSTDPNDVPVQATVTCEIKVNGVVQPSAESFSGTGVVVGSRPVAYTAPSGSVVELCTVVDYTGPFDTTPTATGCAVVPWPPTVPSPVVGWVLMAGDGPFGPVFHAAGDLANPAWWTCTDNGTSTPYQVTCVPQSNTALVWQCDVLQATVATVLPSSTARTTLDCDGGAAEAQTATVSGIGGNDAQAAVANVTVSAFTCTVDDGANGPAVSGWVATCGA